MQVMYLAKIKGALFWGTYMNSTPNRIQYEWTMRRQSMRQNHFYGNSDIAISYERIVGQFHERLALVKVKAKSFEFMSAISIERETSAFYIVDCNGVIEASDGGTINNFINRMKEYPGSYLVPMSKYNTALKSRYPLIPINPV